MRIFVLDDDFDRLPAFRKKWEDVTHATDPIAAAEILRTQKFDIIFLDHDLGGPYTRGPLGDGIDLAKVMAEEKLHVDTPIVIHSLNKVGAYNMHCELAGTHKFRFAMQFYTHIRNRSRIDIETEIFQHVRREKVLQDPIDQYVTEIFAENEDNQGEQAFLPENGRKDVL